MRLRKQRHAWRRYGADRPVWVRGDYRSARAEIPDRLTGGVEGDREDWPYLLAFFIIMFGLVCWALQVASDSMRRRRHMSDRWARRRKWRERERWHAYHPPNANQAFHQLLNPPYMPKSGENESSPFGTFLHFVAIAILAVILTVVLVDLVAWLFEP